MLTILEALEALAIAVAGTGDKAVRVRVGPGTMDALAVDAIVTTYGPGGKVDGPTRRRIVGDCVFDFSGVTVKVQRIGGERAR